MILVGKRNQHNIHENSSKMTSQKLTHHVGNRNQGVSCYQLELKLLHPYHHKAQGSLSQQKCHISSTASPSRLLLSSDDKEYQVHASSLYKASKTTRIIIQLLIMISNNNIWALIIRLFMQISIFLFKFCHYS